MPVYVVISYAKKLAQSSGGKCHRPVLGSSDVLDLKSLGQYGLDVAHQVDDARFSSFDSRAYSMLLVDLSKRIHALVVFALNHRGKALAPRVAARLDLTVPAMALPAEDSTVVRGVNSERPLLMSRQTSQGWFWLKAMLGLLNESTEAIIFDPGLGDDAFSVKVVKVEKMEGGIPLTEADRVVSAGRGLKGPENKKRLKSLPIR